MRIAILCFLPFLFIGCLSSSHHFRKGELLKSGDSEINWGFSSTSMPTCSGKMKRDEDGFNRCVGEVKESSIPNFSRSFRLGVRDQWWIFEGAEIGYQFETNGVLQFDMRLALPQIWLGGGLKHAAGVGWGVGSLPDNSYFLDYSVSKRWNKTILYSSIRQTYVATQIVDIEFEASDNSEDDLYVHHQKWLSQMSLGVELGLGEIYILPDQVNIEILLSSIDVPITGQPRRYDDIGIFPQLNLGMGWHY